MNLKILIIDDERQARRLLHNLVLEKYTDATIFEASNLLDGIEIIKKESIDLVLSDINMPVHSGLEIANYFPPDQMDFKLIFTTAYDQYALEAFKTNALDYILKPVDEDELYTAIDKALQSEKSNDEVLHKLTKAFDKLVINKISLEVPKGFMFVAPDDIIMFEADGMYTHVHLKDNKKELITKPLKHFVDQLRNNVLFYRPQRSFLINLKHIKEVKKDEALFIVMDNYKSITVARDRKKAFMQMLKNVF
ncbi:MAG: LytTR family DNA-binding domain-containing protein [Nonlabens sp.]